MDRRGRKFGIGHRELGLNRVPNFAEYQVFEAVFVEYRVPIPSI